MIESKSHVRFEHVRSNQSRAIALEIQNAERQLRWALEAFPRKRFPGALFSRTSHRRPSRRNHPQHPPPNSSHLPPTSPHPLKLSLFHSGYPHRRRRSHHRHRRRRRLRHYYLHTNALRFYAGFTPFSRSSCYLFPVSSGRKTTL